MPYSAVIEILIDVETETEAMDAVAEAMRPLMQSHNPVSYFRDWNWYWYDKDRNLVKTQPIPENFHPDDEWPDDAK